MNEHRKKRFPQRQNLPERRKKKKHRKTCVNQFPTCASSLGPYHSSLRQKHGTRAVVERAAVNQNIRAVGCHFKNIRAQSGGTLMKILSPDRKTN